MSACGHNGISFLSILRAILSFTKVLKVFTPEISTAVFEMHGIVQLIVFLVHISMSSIGFPETKTGLLSNYYFVVFSECI